MLASKPYCLKNTIETMGPGKTTVRVTEKYQTDGITENSVVNLMQNIFNNNEFERNLTIFNYFRVRGIKIILHPNIKLGSFLSGRMSMNWSSDLLENVMNDDGSKEFGNYLTNYKIFRFRPPNANLFLQNGRVINYRVWTPTNFNLSSSIPPGYLKISAHFQFSFTVECIVDFKGSQTEIIPNRIIKGDKIITENKSKYRTEKPLITAPMKSDYQVIKEDKDEEDFSGSASEEDIKEEHNNNKQEEKDNNKKEDNKNEEIDQLIDSLKNHVDKLRLK